MIEQRLIHGRHAGQRRRLDPLDRRERHLGIKTRQHRNHPARQNRAVQYAGVGKDMEERQHPNDPVRLSRARIKRVNLPRVGGHVLVRQHRPFGYTRGPAGILDQRNFTGIDCNGFERTGNRCHPQYPRIIGQNRNVLALEQLVERSLDRRQRVGNRADNDPVDQPLIQQGRRRGHQLRDITGHNDAGPAVRYLMRKLSDRIERRHVDDKPTGHQCPVIGHQIIGDVGQEQADPITFRHSLRLKPAGEIARSGCNIGIA